MKVSSSFSYSKIAFDQEAKVHLLIQAEAPKLDVSTRKPLNIVVALDASTSMGGQKIDFVRKSATKLVEHLGAEDRLGIIVFDSVVTTLFEPMLMTSDNKIKARHAISGVHSRGCTNFSGAMMEGFKQGSVDKSSTRFIILTDGQPTAGETNKSKLLEFAKNNCGSHLAITCFGYGGDHDPEFLTTLAIDNKGNYAYIQNPDDALTAFARELGGLMSCYAQNLKFKVTPKDGVVISRVVSDVDVVQLEKGVIEISVPDLYSEEVRNIVLEVKTPKQDSILPRAVTLVDVNVSYSDTQSGETKSVGSKAKISFVKKDEADKSPNKDVMSKVAVAELMEAQKEATEAAKRGDFLRAQSVMSDVSMDFMDLGTLAYRDEAVKSLRNRESYNQGEYRLRATASASRSGKYSGGAAGMGVSNSTMDSFVNSFTSGQSVTTPPPQTTTSGMSMGVDLGMSTSGIITPETKDEKKDLSKRRQSKDW